MDYNEQEKNKRNDIHNMSEKKGGITSAFSAATVNNTDNDTPGSLTDTEHNMDKIRSGKQENEDEAKLNIAPVGMSDLSQSSHIEESHSKPDDDATMRPIQGSI